MDLMLTSTLCIMKEKRHRIINLIAMIPNEQQQQYKQKANSLNWMAAVSESLFGMCLIF